jgi:exosortase E/protease (VPEID-CTERM system)
MIPKVSSSRSFFWLNLVLAIATNIVFANLVEYELLPSLKNIHCGSLYKSIFIQADLNFDVTKFVKLGLLSFFFIIFFASKKISDTLLHSQLIPFSIAKNKLWIWIVNLVSMLTMKLIHEDRGWCFIDFIDYRLLTLIWLFSFTVWAVSFVALVITYPRFIKLIKNFKKTILGSLFFSIIISVISATSLNNINVETAFNNSFFKATIFMVAHFISLLNINLMIDIQERTVGINQFIVLIGDGCLGYRGISILTLLVFFYLYQFKKILKYPHVFLIIPIIYFIIVITNSFRIALLLLIGEYVSPNIAIIGFHSIAGWINIFIIAILALYCLTHLSFFTYKKSRFTIDLKHRKVELVPEICLIGFSLIFLLVNNGFDWAYPIKIILVALVIKHLWSKFRISFSPLKWTPFLIGLMTVFVWLLLVKDDIKTSRLFAEHIFSAQSWQAYLWLIFRILGSSVIVPIAEELCFRGYFFDATQQFLKSKFNEIKKINLNIAALIFTSILFGSLHSDWLAGFLAGLLFSIARMYRNRISDAIIAHAVTNFFLSLYIIYYQSWSLW